MGCSVCQITVYKDRPRIRIEGTYVQSFYDQLKKIVPGAKRAYIPAERYWLVDRSFFCRVFELAYDCFSKIHLIENGKADEYVTRKGRGGTK